MVNYIVKHKKITEGLGIGCGFEMDEAFIPLEVVSVDVTGVSGFNFPFNSPASEPSLNQILSNSYLGAILPSLMQLDLRRYQKEAGDYSHDTAFTDYDSVYLIYLVAVNSN